MSQLLRKPNGTSGKVHDITPESAGWGYVGFGLYRLQPGESAAEITGDREVILVLVEGKAHIRVAGQDWGILGDRMDVFEKTPPHCLYVPNGSDWQATATTACTLAVCTAPGKSGHKAAQAGGYVVGVGASGFALGQLAHPRRYLVSIKARPCAAPLLLGIAVNLSNIGLCSGRDVQPLAASPAII